jgi:PKD repeat protein
MIQLFRFKIIITLFLGLSFNTRIVAQCINTFPNIQDFESSSAWTSGGSNSDWAWGNPSKPKISSASSGSNCWVIGGLLNSNYSGLQQSYIESPCYDFSALSCPVVSFNVFWEMEFKYDGAGLQYSINNGASWQSVGASNEPTNCMTQNWYNYSNINYLTSNSKQGWSGNSKSTSGGCQGGSGSLNWVLAKHCLGNLSGKSNVKFRFVFGSGSSCNSFDGFAIDNFKIEDAELSINSFTNTCHTFTSIDTTCIQASSFLWNFGDPLSNSNNTSTLSSANHVYTTPGSYIVSLTKTGGTCSLNTTFTKTISVLGSEISSFSNVSCKGANDGTASVTPLFGNGSYSYTWSPEGGNSAKAYSLSPGTYSTIIKDAIGCITTNTLEINEPLPLITSTSETLSSCAGDQIQLEINTSGISDPISYLWSPGSFTSSYIQISPTVTTIYTLNILITGTCNSAEQKIFTTEINPKPFINFLKPNDKGCAPYCVSGRPKFKLNR